MKTGVDLIAQERQEQIEKHGYSVQYDDDEYSLAVQKESLLRDAAIATINCDAGDFPAKWSEAKIFHIIDKPYKDRLIIAGALIAAEIDRLLEAERQKGGSE